MKNRVKLITGDQSEKAVGDDSGLGERLREGVNDLLWRYDTRAKSLAEAWARLDPVGLIAVPDWLQEDMRAMRSRVDGFEADRRVGGLSDYEKATHAMSRSEVEDAIREYWRWYQRAAKPSHGSHERYADTGRD